MSCFTCSELRVLDVVVLLHLLKIRDHLLHRLGDNVEMARRTDRGRDLSETQALRVRRGLPQDAVLTASHLRLQAGVLAGGLQEETLLARLYGFVEPGLGVVARENLERLLDPCEFLSPRAHALVPLVGLGG